MNLRSLGTSPPKSPRTTEKPQTSQQVEHDPPEPPARPCMQPGLPSVGSRLQNFRKWVANLAPDQVDWTTQLLVVVPQVATPEDVHDWFDAVTPALCEACPDLLLRLSEQLRHVLPLRSFTPDEVRKCVAICLDTAWAAKQSAPVWTNLCAGLVPLSLAGMRALLACLREQRDEKGQLPSNGTRLIRHVHWVSYGTGQLPKLGFGNEPGTTQVLPIEAPLVEGQLNEIVTIDTGTERIAYLSRDALMMVMAHLLKKLGIDWMRPQLLSPPESNLQLLRNLSWISRHFFVRFNPMAANHSWMKAETDIRGALRSAKEGRLDALIKRLIHELVDLKAPRVASMLPCAPGVAHRRLDLMLRALFGLCSAVPGKEDGWLTGAYLKLHDRAVLQLASRRGAMLPYFAQHIDMSALPLQMLAMTDRMLGFRGTDLTRLAFILLNDLPVYPEEVQAQTLISLLSLLVDEDTYSRLLSRLGKLMQESDSWPTAAPHAWLRCQWTHLGSMLALLESPTTAGVAPDQVLNDLLAALQQHHGVGSRTALLVDDPFGERYVPWTIADIRLLAALCLRAEESDAWKPPGLVDCLVNLLRQFCSVSASTYKFVGPNFMSEFPTKILRSAFLQLTAAEQSLMLVRIYAPDAKDEESDHMGLIKVFVMNEDIEFAERQLVLTLIESMRGQDPQCRKFVLGLMQQLS